MYRTRKVAITLIIGVAATVLCTSALAAGSDAGPLPPPKLDSSDLRSTTGEFSSAGSGVHFAPTDALAENATDPAKLCIFCSDYWRLLNSDVRHTLTSPARWTAGTWESVGVKSIAIMSAAALLDQSAQTEADEHKSTTTDRIADDFEPFGKEYAGAVLGGFLLAGALTRRPNAKAVAVDGLTTTLIASGLIVPVLKEITGRSRPRANQGAHDVRPFAGGHSFPSGHAAAAFSVAASIAEHYDPVWVKVLSFGTASMVAYARLEKDAHYLSDVTAGAMIGVGVAHSVYRFNRGNRESWALYPTYDPRSEGFELSVEFAMR